MKIILSEFNKIQENPIGALLILILACSTSVFGQSDYRSGPGIGYLVSGDQTGGQDHIFDIPNFRENSLGLSIDKTQTTYVSYRSGGRVFYGIVGAGFNFRNKTRKYAYSAGIGARLFSAKTFHLKTELIASGLESFKESGYYISSSYLLLAFKVSKSIEIFAGPSFNSLKTNNEEGKSIIKHYISSKTDGRHFQGYYFGYTFGIQLHL